MLGLLGISHNSAPIEIRERFSFSNEEIVPFSEHLTEIANFNDIVIISTCNRTEIYFSQTICGEDEAFMLLGKALSSFKNEQLDLLAYTYQKSDEAVVKHLFRVTAGVDSMVIGEDQIIGQVKDAYLFCTKAALTDSVLMRLFQKSFEAGKRVRTETKIKQGATSISYVAVDMCSTIVKNLKDKTVLAIGAGETNSLAIQGLYKKGVRNFTIANRTVENTTLLAHKYDASTIPLDTFQSVLSDADIILVATGASEPIVLKQMITDAQNRRKGAFQLYIDLSVPRNIDEQAASIDSIKLVTVDDLQEIIEVNTDKRKECVADAEKIISEVSDEFVEWLSFRALRPAIRSIKFNLQKIHRDEMAIHKDSLSTEEKSVIDDYSQKLITKYERALIKNMKYMTNNGKKKEYLSFINKLFRMD